MRGWIVWLLSVLLTTPAGAAGVGGEAAAFVGTIVHIEAKDSSTFAAERAMYVHENLQTIVVDVDRVLIGPDKGKRVLVGVTVDDKKSDGIKWMTGSYGLLDPNVWKVGTRVIVFAKNDDAAADACGAPTYTTIDGQSRFQDPALEKYRGNPQWCASVRDVYLLK